MPRWQFWKSSETPEPTVVARPTPDDQPRTASYGSPPRLRTPTTSVLSPERRERRIGDLIRRRDGLRFDIEQGELALSPDNPWRERISLLQESIATIAADRAALASIAPEPTWTVPALPVSQPVVTSAEPSRVSFRVGDQPLDYVEASDWDNRGGMVVHGDLRRTGGDPGLIATGADPVPPPDWQPILETALATFALTVRDAALEGTASPNVKTLRDIIREDDEVGGWTNLHGTNNVRVQRAYRRQELRAEEERLRQELTREDEQRRTLTDRLPIARKRLATVMDDLVTLGVDPDQV